MQIRVLDRLADLEAHAGRWNELLARSRSNSIFLTWEWIEPWWQTFGAELELAVLVGEEHGQLVGIAPLMIAPHPSPGGRYIRTLMFLGQGGDTLAEHLDLILEPGREPELAEAFVDHLCGPLRRRWDALLLERIIEDSPNRTLVIERFRERGVVVVARNELPAPYLRLPESMDSLLAAKSSNFRYQYQRSRKRLLAMGAARFMMAGQDLPVEEAMAILADLNRERWQDAGASFRTDRYRRFHSALAQRFHERDWLWLSILTLDGQPIAARYDFVYGGKAWCMQGGWKPSLQNLNLGLIMTGEVIAWAIGRGLREYDFLGGEDHYKSRWADAERTLVDLEAFNTATLRGRSWPRLRSLKRALSPASA
jgi:CelD/BcsL family acetyltransferase involved in cellulose biosynthesis